MKNNIIKSGDADNPFYYLENVANGDKLLDYADYTILSSALKNVDLYEGAVDKDYSNLIIERISKVKKASTKINDISQ